jgi:hypothetical protein
MAVTFDTHKLITRLTQGQMTLEQAEAVSEALSQALEGSIGQLATKEDVTNPMRKRRGFQEPASTPSSIGWTQGPRGRATTLLLAGDGPNIRGRTYDDEPNVFYAATDCLPQCPIRCQ